MATDGRQCAHIWAQQTKESGRGYGSISFQGDTLYSYREPIGRIVKTARGTAALLRDCSFSVTTSKHQSYMRGAVSHMRSFTVPDLHLIHSDDVRKSYAQKVDGAALRAARARSHGEFHLQQAADLAREANECAEFFGWKWRLDVPEFSPEFIAEVKAKAAKETAARRAQAKAREEALRATIGQSVAEWLRGESQRVDYRYSGDVLLRVNGDRVQTSKGAEIPVTHARRIWPLILSVKARGAEYEVDRAKGYIERVGEFKIDRIAADGTLTAGCHTIKFDQIERIAKVLNLA